jgi:hypothetical protein
MIARCSCRTSALGGGTFYKLTSSAEYGRIQQSIERMKWLTTAAYASFEVNKPANHIDERGSVDHL